MIRKNLSRFFVLIFLFLSVNEVERTRADGNIIKVTEYDLAKDNYDSRISEAVRTHKEKGKFSDRQSSRPRQSNTATSAYPVPVRNT